METTVTKATMGLIPISYHDEEITVLGRDLHAALEVKSDYTHWIKRMIEYGFEEGVDYIQIAEKDLVPVEKDWHETDELKESQTVENNELDSTQPFRIKVPINHQLKLDMAKEIAMIQRSEAGRKVRKYFIEVEKQYRETLSNRFDLKLPYTDKTALAIDSASQRARAFSTLRGVHEGIAIAHAFNEVEKEFRVDLTGWKQLIPAAETTPVDYNPTQIAEKLSDGVNYKLLVCDRSIICAGGIVDRN